MLQFRQFLLLKNSLPHYFLLYDHHIIVYRLQSSQNSNTHTLASISFFSIVTLFTFFLSRCSLLFSSYLCVYHIFPIVSFRSFILLPLIVSFFFFYFLQIIIFFFVVHRFNAVQFLQLVIVLMLIVLLSVTIKFKKNVFLFVWLLVFAIMPPQINKKNHTNTLLKQTTKNERMDLAINFAPIHSLGQCENHLAIMTTTMMMKKKMLKIHKSRILFRMYAER